MSGTAANVDTTSGSNSGRARPADIPAKPLRRNSSASRVPVIILSEYTESDLGHLRNNLHSVRNKWRDIGDQLCLPPGELEAIQEDHANTNDRLRAVLRSRLREGPITAEDLSDVLNSPIVGEGDLARMLCNAQTTDGSFPAITKANVLHFIKPDISDAVFPYTKLKTGYSLKSDVPFVLFILLQILTVIDNGIFMPMKYPRERYTNRLVFFVLYTFLMIVTPTVCYVQLCRLGYLERRSKTEPVAQTPLIESVKRKIDGILEDRNLAFSPLHFLSQCFSLLKLDLQNFDITGFQVPLHAIIVPMLLYYLGVFHDFQGYQPIGPIHRWWQNLQINGVSVIEVWVCFAIFITLCLSGTVKDVYCIENHLANVLVKSEPSPANGRTTLSTTIYQAIRDRWRWFDSYVQIALPLVFAALTIGLMMFGEPFTARNPTANVFEQFTWNSLTVLITVMQLAGSSASRLPKLLCITAYFLLPLLMYTAVYMDENIFKFELVQNGFNFHLAPGNVSLLIFTTQSVSLMNWLLCLFRSYLGQNVLKNAYHCIAAVIVVGVCLLCVSIREGTQDYQVIRTENGNCTCLCKY